jgi:hypothetical protein
LHLIAGVAGTLADDPRPHWAGLAAVHADLATWAAWVHAHRRSDHTARWTGAHSGVTHLELDAIDDEIGHLWHTCNQIRDAWAAVTDDDHFEGRYAADLLAGHLLVVGTDVDADPRPLPPPVAATAVADRRTLCRPWWEWLDRYRGGAHPDTAVEAAARVCADPDLAAHVRRDAGPRWARLVAAIAARQPRDAVRVMGVPNWRNLVWLPNPDMATRLVVDMVGRYGPHVDVDFADYAVVVTPSICGTWGAVRAVAGAAVRILDRVGLDDFDAVDTIVSGHLRRVADTAEALLDDIEHERLLARYRAQRRLLAVLPVDQTHQP